MQVHLLLTAVADRRFHDQVQLALLAQTHFPDAAACMGLRCCPAAAAEVQTLVAAAAAGVAAAALVLAFAGSDACPAHTPYL